MSVWSRLCCVVKEKGKERDEGFWVSFLEREEEIDERDLG